MSEQKSFKQIKEDLIQQHENIQKDLSEVFKIYNDMLECIRKDLSEIKDNENIIVRYNYIQKLYEMDLIPKIDQINDLIRENVDTIKFIDDKNISNMYSNSIKNLDKIYETVQNFNQIFEHNIVQNKKFEIKKNESKETYLQFLDRIVFDEKDSEKDNNPKQLFKLFNDQKLNVKMEPYVNVEQPKWYERLYNNVKNFFNSDCRCYNLDYIDNNEVRLP